MGTSAAASPAVPPPVPNRVLDDPDDWEYFSEGANNVLYRYVGADSFFVRRSLSFAGVSSLYPSNLYPEALSAPSTQGPSGLADNPAVA